MSYKYSERHRGKKLRVQKYKKNTKYKQTQSVIDTNRTKKRIGRICSKKDFNWEIISTFANLFCNKKAHKYNGDNTYHKERPQAVRIWQDNACLSCGFHHCRCRTQHYLVHLHDDYDDIDYQRCIEQLHTHCRFQHGRGA